MGYADEQMSPQMMGPGQGNFGIMGDPIDPKTKRRRGNLPKPVTDILRAWFHEHLDHPYPSEEDKQMFMTRTGLSISQVRFCNRGLAICCGCLANGFFFFFIYRSATGLSMLGDGSFRRCGTKCAVGLIRSLNDSRLLVMSMDRSTFPLLITRVAMNLDLEVRV